MKKQTLLIIFVSLLTMFSCTDDLTCECNELDIKASKIEQIGSLFEAISRNPDTYEVLMKNTEVVYSDYTELLPLSDKAVSQRGIARGHSFGLLFYSLCRNPNAFEELDFAATKFMGVYDENEISDELLDISKMYSISGLNEGLARNPYADGLCNILCKKYLDFEIEVITPRTN